MTIRPALALLVAAIPTLVAPARAADPPPPRTDCSRSTDPRERPADSDTRRVATDDQLCFQVDRDRQGRALEFFGGKLDANRPRSGDDASLERTRDEIERQDGFFGLRLRMPY